MPPPTREEYLASLTPEQRVENIRTTQPG
ncbi:hypothetical protein LCGC14_1638840, partial [marine sediment metagenome]